MKKKKGIFITFEGIEGCGKSTQAELLADHLKKNRQMVLLTREPGGPQISEKIREILLDKNNSEMLPETEILLYMASRSQHTGEWIIPELKKGVTVISDRYFDSTLAYQGAARKIERNIIDTLNNFATFDLVPDITFLIDLPVEIGLSRLEKRSIDRLESESRQFHERVRSGFLEVALVEKDRYFILDGMKKIEEINRDVIEKMDEFRKGWKL